MSAFLQTYIGLGISVGLIVLVGVLASQGLLGGDVQDLVTGLVLGGGGGLMVGAKITPK